MSNFLPKNFYFNGTAMRKLMKGAEKVYNAVSVTAGASGNLVMMNDASSVFPRATKDGVTVASNIYLKDEAENFGAMQLIQASREQVKESGDGTTLTIILAYEFLKRGMKAIKCGADPVGIIKGMKTAVDKVISQLEADSKETTDEDIIDVATVACNGNRDIGKIISDAIIKVGRNGIVSHASSFTGKTFVEYSEGYQWDRGYEYTQFMNNSLTGTMDFDNPLILVTDMPMAFGSDLAKAASIAKNRPLIIIAEDVKDEALASMVSEENRQQGYRFATIKVGGHDKKAKFVLEDIAGLTGATVISRENGLTFDTLEEKHLGTCDKISSSYLEKTIIHGGNTGKRLGELKNIKTEDEYLKDLIKNSIAKLDGGLAVIKVYAHSETERKEIIDRVDDAIKACRSAQEEGIVNGGGVALLKVKPRFVGLDKNVQRGGKIIYDSIDAPAKKILSNANAPLKIVKEIKDNNHYSGYSLEKRKVFSNMFALGIVDPVKVIRTALLNALSVSVMLLQSKVLIIDKGVQNGNR